MRLPEAGKEETDRLLEKTEGDRRQWFKVEPRESRVGRLETKEASGSPDWENVVEHTPEKEMRRHTVHIKEEHEQWAAQGRPAARKRPNVYYR